MHTRLFCWFILVLRVCCVCLSVQVTRRIWWHTSISSRTKTRKWSSKNNQTFTGLLIFVCSMVERCFTVTMETKHPRLWFRTAHVQKKNWRIAQGSLVRSDWKIFTSQSENKKTKVLPLDYRFVIVAVFSYSRILSWVVLLPTCILSGLFIVKKTVDFFIFINWCNLRFVLFLF